MPRSDQSARDRRVTSRNNDRFRNRLFRGLKKRPAILEPLEGRFCLTAEFDYVITSNNPSNNDVFDSIKIGADGSIFVSSTRELIKYDSNRQVVWRTPIRDAWEIEIDNSGNVYANGPLSSGMTLIGANGNITIAPHNNNPDSYLAKFDSSGKVLWATALGGTLGSVPAGVAVDPNGNVSVAASFGGTLSIGGSTLVSTGTGGDIAVVNFSASGTVRWASQIGGTSTETAASIAVDPQGNAYLTGYFSGTVQLNGTSLTAAGSRDAIVARVNENGSVAWAVNMGGGSLDEGRTIAVDPAGYVVTLGTYSGPADFDPSSAGVYNLPFLGLTSGSDDVYVSKLDLNGNFVWARPIGGNASNYSTSVAIGPGGAIHFTGHMDGMVDYDPSSDSYFVNSPTSDPYVGTLSSDGEFLAARSWGGSSLDVGVGVAVDSAGAVYVAGYFIGSNFTVADFDPGPGTHLLSSNSTQDGFILKLKPPTGVVGDFVWSDLNGNGLQDVGEPGLANAVIELFSSPDATVGNFDDGRIGLIVTDETGHYSFDQLASGNYYVMIHAPVGYAITTPNIGPNGSIDSNLMLTGVTPMFTLQPGEQLLGQDAGVTGASPAFGFGLRAGANGDDFGNAVVTDGNGFIYLTGQFQNTVDFDPGPATYNLVASGLDAFVAKYTSTGALVWARRIGGTGTDSGVDLAVDDLGNTYATGRFGNNVDVEPGAGTLSIPSSSSTSDIYIVKLDSIGNYVWGKGFGGAAENIGGIALDSNRNVFLAGNFSGTADFNPTLGPSNVFNVTSGGSFDAFVLKLTEGGDFDWVKTFGGLGEDAIRDLAVDANGGLYATGYFSGTADFNPAAGPTNVANLVSAGGFDSFISKLNANGLFEWAIRHGNTGADQDSNAIRVDSDGNVYTAGGFLGTVAFDPTLPGGTLTSAGISDIYVSKRNAAGNLLWVRRFGGTGADIAYGLDTDIANDVYVTGQFSTTAAFGDADTSISLTSAGITDAFVAKLDSAGESLAAYRLGGTQADRGRSIRVDTAFGHIHTTGNFAGTADFDPGLSQFLLVGQGTAGDIFVSQLDQNSRPQNILLSGQVVVESQGMQTVGTINAVDLDVNDTFSLQLLNDAGGRFSLSGNQLIANTSLIDFEATPSLVIRIRATDAGGLAIERDFTIQVLNANEAPVVAPLANGVAQEGALFSVSGSFTDPDAGDSWTATVDYGDGLGLQALSLLPDQSFVLAHAYTDNGTFTIAVSIKDAGGLIGAQSLQVVVSNVAPQNVALTGPTIAVRGQTLSFAGAFTDPGSSDTHTVTWDFGDGSAPITIPASSGALLQSHVFVAAGTFTVSLTVIDDDGGMATATLNVVVTSFGLQPDPSDPGSTALVIGGSPSDDTIRILPDGTSELRVTVNGDDIGTFSAITKVIVFGQDGNDDIQAAGSIGVDCWFFGGAGNDKLKGGAGHDALLGGTGNDQIQGGLGRDLLVGGTGADQLIGNTDDDILLAADVNFGDIVAAVADIMREWTSQRSFLERVENLKGDTVGPMANGSTFFIAGQSVFDDGVADQLIGSSDNDWFLANGSQDSISGVEEAFDDLEGWL